MFKNQSLSCTEVVALLIISKQEVHVTDCGYSSELDAIALDKLIIEGDVYVLTKF